MPNFNSTNNVAAVPSLTGAGTGVLTALAVNTGSAGAVVVNGGALGTPASGDLSNCTGLPNAAGTLISSQTASNLSSIIFTGLSSAYSRYDVEMINVIPASDAPLQAFLSTNNGSSYITSNYAGTASYVAPGDSFAVISTSSSRIDVTYNNGSAQYVDNASTNGLCGTLTLWNPGSTANYKQIVADVSWTNPGGAYATGHAAQICTNTTSAVNAIKIAFPSINITSGKFNLIGIK
jgi:hypothetical protein